MKTSFLFIALLLFITSTLFAQAPNKMTYQAVIRNGSNVLVSNSPIGMRVSILQGSPTGSSVFTETHTTTSNLNGLVSIIIGTGSLVSGSFSAINWQSGPYFIKTETDPTGGSSYSIIGVSECASVPFAKYAGAAPPAPGNAFGDMMFWNGSIWQMIPTGAPGQFLQISPAGVPTWQGASYPSVVTAPITNINPYGARCGLTITSNGGSAITACGLVAGTSPNPTVTNNVSYSYPYAFNLGIFTSQVSAIGFAEINNQEFYFSSSSFLTPSTTYYVRAYVTNSAGTIYGNQVVFATPPISSPYTTTDSIPEILATSAKVYGFATYPPYLHNITQKGFVYATTPNPTLSNSVSNLGANGGGYSTFLNGLTPSTTYYVRTYATNSLGTTYGNQMSFTTCIPQTFTVGQAYGGGTIFYVDCSGLHGLIAANSTHTVTTAATCTNVVAGISDGINAGQNNTNLLVASCGASNNAAYYCDTLNYNGYSDWFLPSGEQLFRLATNLPSSNFYGQAQTSNYYSTSFLVVFMNTPFSQGYTNGSNVPFYPIRTF
jgi:hypothetical protein